MKGNYSLASQMVAHNKCAEQWKVTLVDTGMDTLTAGRILKIGEYIDEDEFFLTYGDGVLDVDIDALIDFHHQSGCVATITTAQPAGRFGAVRIDNETGRIKSFREKARTDQAWVNAGFMVLDRKVFDYLGAGDAMLETGPFERLAHDGQMAAYKHYGFWAPMDTMSDKEYLERLWEGGCAPWKLWR